MIKVRVKINEIELRIQYKESAGLRACSLEDSQD